MEFLQIAAAIGGLAFLAILLTLIGLGHRRLDLRRRLHLNSESENEDRGFTVLGKRLEQAVKPLGEIIPRSPAEMSRQEKKLVQAGFRRKDAVILFFAAQAVTVILLAAGFAATGYMYKSPFLYGVLSLLGGAAIPDIWLKRRGMNRSLNIQHGLPDAMDLTVIAVEAGLGLDQALLRVGEEIRIAYPELADELQLRNLEVNMGRSRSEAFRNLAERAGVEDLKALVAILIQTDKFGTSIGDALRTFSDTLRTKRRQRAEEQAAKLAVKMIVPMVLFIFPGVFVVILGPPFISIIRDLLPRLGGN